MATSSGGNSNDIRSGGAFVEIYGRDKLTGELKRLGAETQTWADKFKKITVDIQGKFAAGKEGASNLFSGNLSNALGGGKEGGGLGKLFGGGVKVGAVAAGIGVAVAAAEKLDKLADHISDLFGDWALGIRDAAKEIPRLKEFNDQIAAAGDRYRADLFESLGGKLQKPVEKVPDAKKMEVATGDLETSKMTLKRLEQELKQAKEKKEALEHGTTQKLKEIGTDFMPEKLGRQFQRSFEVDKQTANAKVEELTRQRDAMKQHTRDMEGHIAAMKALEKELKAKNYLDWAGSKGDMEKDLEVQLATLHMTAEEAQIYRLEMDGAKRAIEGAGQALDPLREKVKDIFSGREFKGMIDEWKNAAKDLEDQIAGFGMNPIDARIKRLVGKDKWNLARGQLETINPEDPEPLKKKKEATNAGILAAQNAVEMATTLKGLEALQKLQEESLHAAMKLTRGSFSSAGLSNQLGISDRWQAKQVDLLKEANGFLGQIAGKVLTMQPWVFK